MSDYGIIAAGIAIAIVAVVVPLAGKLAAVFQTLACGLADSSVCVLTLLN